MIAYALILISSCNPKISTRISRTYPTLDYNQEVVVIGLEQTEPDNAEVLGKVKIGDTGFISPADTVCYLNLNFY